MANAIKSNGQTNRIEESLLGEPMTLGYRPTLPVDTMWGPDGNPFLFFRRDIEFMLLHPAVRTALNYFKAGIAGAEFWGGQDPNNPDNEQGLPICPQSEKIGAFIRGQCERFWDRGVPLLQSPGYEYGWSAGEACYCEEDGVMKWDSLEHFAPRDTFILTQDKKPVGVRVKNVQDKGNVDLWLADGDIPAKGLWYTHDPRYSRWYGQSQLLGAWRPWRRLAWKDGAETVLDGGIYRFAYAGPEVGYPQEDMQGPLGSPGTTLDSQGNPRKYARDMARMIGEQAKAGATIGLPTTPYPKEQGGGPKWYVKWPSTVLNCDPILNYIVNLHKQISYGCGVPPELLEAGETGSGYSGRRIPMEAFLDGQQKIGDAFLQLFVDQVIKPLVLWNFGDIRFDVKLKRFVKTKAKDSGQTQQPPGAPQPGVQPQGAAMSLLYTDRVREIARAALRAA